MSLRATTDHTDFYGRVHLFEIYDEDWDGGVTAHKNTGEGFGDFSHQKIDPRKPWENPIQKGALELSLWLEDSSQQQLLTDIKEGDEQQFYIIHYIDGEQEWQGYIYNDLTTYEENILPFRVTLMAKDFTDLGGKDYLVSSSLPDSREQVIETIAYLLNTVGFDIPIRTHTNWIEEHITASEDYLRQIYHETKALREFGRTGDEEDQPITVEDALNKLLSNHKLILKQTNGAYYLDQLTALDDPENVLEAEYDLTGSLESESTGNDLTVDANTTDLSVVYDYDNRINSGLPGLKRVTNTFDHRTDISNIQFPDRINLDQEDGSATFQQLFISDGDQEISIEAVINAVYSGQVVNDARMIMQIQIGNYFWDGSDLVESPSTFQVELIALLDPGQHQGYLSVDIEDIPADADGTFAVSFSNVTSPTEGDADSTTVSGVILDIINPIASQNTDHINYQLTQPGGYSEVLGTESTWYGDGPIGYSPGALRTGTGTLDFTFDSWQFRGSTDWRNFHENHTKESMNTQRGWRQLLSALLKGVYKPHQVLSYDSTHFFYLGGSQDIYTGNWNIEFFELNIETGSDNFDDILKYTDEEGTGSGSTGGSTGGGSGISEAAADGRYFKQNSNLSEGDPATIRSNIDVYSTTEADNLFLSESDADDLYLEEANNLSDLENITTAQDNLGLTDGSADLDFNSLIIREDTFINTVGGEIYYNFDGDSSDRRILGMSDDSLGSSSGLLSELRFDPENIEWDFGQSKVKAENFWAGKPTDSDPGLSDTDTFSEASGYIVGDAGYILDNDNVRLNVISRNGLRLWTDERTGTAINAVDIVDNGNATFNQRLTASDGNFVAHENGWAYFDVAGQNFVFNTDTTTRSILEVKRGAIGDTGTTNRLWQMRITDTDNFQFDPATGGNVEIGRLELGDWAGTESYTSGILGSGTRWDMDATGGTFFEIDNMRVRNALRAHIFTKDIVQAMNAFTLFSDSASIAENKTLDDNTAGQTLRIDAGDGNSTFSTGMLVWAKNIRDDGSLVINGLKAEVTNVDTSNSDYTILTLDTSNGGNGDEVFDGDVLVRVNGGYLMADASSQFSPFLDVYDGVNTWSDFQSADKLKGRYGNLNGLTIDSVALSGYGLYSDNVYLTNSVLVGDLTETINYMKFDGTSMTINTELFNLESSNLLLRDFAGGQFIVGDVGTADVVGMTGNTSGSGGGDSVALWVGDTYPNRTTAPIWMKRNGAFSLADGAISGTPTSASINVDDLFVEAGGSGFESADFYLNSTATQLSLGDVFSADGNDGTAKVAGFNANYRALWSQNNAGDGAGGWKTQGIYIQSEFELLSFGSEFWYDGRPGNREGQLAGFAFDADQLSSTNLSGGGDGDFTDDGILINSGGYISAENFWIDSSGAGALGDLDVDGDLTMTSNGMITDNEFWRISADSGLDFSSGEVPEVSANSIEFRKNSLTDNSQLMGQLYAYHDTGEGITNFVLRAQNTVASESHILLTATRMRVNALALFNETVLVDGNLRVAPNNENVFEFPSYTDSNRPDASSLDSGSAIYNSDAGNIQYVDNAGSWQGV